MLHKCWSSVCRHLQQLVLLVAKGADGGRRTACRAGRFTFLVPVLQRIFQALPLRALTCASCLHLCRLFEVLSKLQSHGVALPGPHGPRLYTLRYGGEVPQDGNCLFQALALALGGLQSASEVRCYLHVTRRPPGCHP